MHIAIASQLGDGLSFALTLRGHDDTGEILIRATCFVFIHSRAIIATGLIARRLLHLMSMQKLVLLALMVRDATRVNVAVFVGGEDFGAVL